MKIIAPEKNHEFTALAEACKKLRNVEVARVGLCNLAKPRKGRPAVLDPTKLAVLLAPLTSSAPTATAVLAGVAIVIATGECAQFVMLGPIVADLAPPHLLGRYMLCVPKTYATR